MADETKLECPACGSNEFDDNGGERDWEGEEGYWEVLVCSSCQAEVVAVYEAKLTQVSMRMDTLV